MKRTRHTPEQIVRKLREADRLLAENTPLAEVMRSLGVSHQTYQRWRSPDDHNSRIRGRTRSNGAECSVEPRARHLSAITGTSPPKEFEALR